MSVTKILLLRMLHFEWVSECDVCKCVWVHTWEREMHRQGEIFGFILFWHIALGSYFFEKRASFKTFLFLFCSVTRMREKEEEARVIVCLSLCLSCFKEFPCFVLFCLAELLQNSPPFPAAKRCSVTLMIVPVELKNFSGCLLAYVYLENTLQDIHLNWQFIEKHSVNYGQSQFWLVAQMHKVLFIGTCCFVSITLKVSG